MDLESALQELEKLNIATCAVDGVGFVFVHDLPEGCWVILRRLCVTWGLKNLPMFFSAGCGWLGMGVHLKPGL